MTVVAEVLGCVALAALLALVAIALWPWRIEATVKARTAAASAISLAGGLQLAGASGSAAAILGGPGVLAVHVRGRELWKRPIARVSLEALLSWIDDLASKPSSPPGLVGRMLGRAWAWLLPRTDKAQLPELGLRVLLGMRDLSLHGAITCGFSDPALTGKAAAFLFPIAGVLAPLGKLDISFDWSGKNRLDGGIDVSFRAVPARIALEGLRFAWHHVHLRPALAAPPPSSTMQSITT